MLTWIEISAKAVRHNLREFRSLIGKKVLLMPVIKSNAYGHGFLEIAALCDKNKDVDRLCVVNLDEAVTLIKNKISKPIVILSIYDTGDHKNLAIAIKNKVAFPLYTLEQATKLSAIGKKINRTVSAHLKIDTGASRVGLLPDEMLTFVKKIQKKFPNIYFEGLWSHFSASETDDQQTRRQWGILDKVESELRKKGVCVPLKHMACSAATMVAPLTHGNAVRVGLGLYGLYPSDRTRTNKLDLRPVLTLRTTIIQLKTIPAGTKISYGGTYTTRHRTKLAVLPIGYFDGYDRKFSNRAEVLIQGKRCSVRGRVCMNLTMVDVTKIKKIRAGDTVTVIGADRNQSITADELAKIAGTINYEIVARINPTVKRIVV